MSGCQLPVSCFISFMPLMKTNTKSCPLNLLACTVFTKLYTTFGTQTNKQKLIYMPKSKSIINQYN